MPPAVSVILPVRNGARYLGLAAGSILAQTFSDLELLVVDDGSEDATPAILARMAQADPRVRVLSGPPLGLVAALNRGLHAAASSFIARMDADDVAWPDRLARQMALLTSEADVVAVGTGWRVVDADGTARRVVRPPASPDAIRAALRRSNPIAHPTVLMRREAVLAVGGYRAAFRQAQDLDLWLRLAEHHDLRNVPEPLLDLREHGGQSLWQSVERRVLSEMCALAAAAHRADGRDDGIGAATPIDYALLRRLGQRDDAIRDGLLGRALGLAKYALQLGQRRAAREAVALALRQPRLHVRTRVHLWLLRARAGLG
jgi:glycosyltransferase involved in cell wall biosynthesis